MKNPNKQDKNTQQTTLHVYFSLVCFHIGLNEVTFSTGFNHCSGLDSICDAKTDGTPLTDWMTQSGQLLMTLTRSHTMKEYFQGQKRRI